MSEEIQGEPVLAGSPWGLGGRLVEVSQGAYARVFHWRTPEGKDWAVKHMVWEDDPVGKAHQQRVVNHELEASRDLQHPHVLPIVSHWSTSTAQRLVMAYQPLDLNTLLWQVHVCGSSPPGFRPAELAQQLLEAVAYVHRQGWVHCDLKPANIVVNAAGTHLYLIDFGAAEKVPASKVVPYEYPVTTLWYRSPEMLLNLPFYTNRSDLWSVGCVLYQLYTGRVLFAGVSRKHQLRLIFELRGTPTSATWPGWSPELWKEATHVPKANWHVPGLNPAVLEGLLTLCPHRRWTAEQALERLESRKRKANEK